MEQAAPKITERFTETMERSETIEGNSGTNEVVTFYRVKRVVNVPVTFDTLVLASCPAEAVEKAKSLPITRSPKAIRHWDLADNPALVSVENVATGELDDLSGLETSRLRDVERS